jgi:HSP20 family molecular chaperone IbpA
MFPWNLFPFNEDMKKKMDQMKPEDIESFTRGMMGKMMPKQMHGMMNPEEMIKGFFPDSINQHSEQQHSTLQSSVFETHEYVFIRIVIESDEWLKDIKIYHTSNLMFIEQIPYLDDKHTITLPAIVKKKGATARYKDGTLEVKLPKSIDMQFSEIDVNDIL